MRNRLTFLLAALMLGTFMSGASTPGSPSLRERLGVFSWHEENVTDPESRDRMFDTLSDLGAGEVYQAMRAGRGARAFLEQAHGLGIGVYVLAGQPEWGLDPQGKAMVEEVERVAEMRERYGDAGPAGLMLDVEPYLTRKYRRGTKDAREVMDAFLEGMRAAYARAGEKGVTLLFCLPYWLDTRGFADHVDALIGEASDGVALMNYMKSNEAANVENELAAAQRNGKRFIHIYELQRPGKYGLTERNTYYREGLEGVFQSREKLLDAYDYEGLSFALHEYDALKGILDRE